MTAGSKVVALSGGIGGAKLAYGLSQVLMNDELSIIANTGDDFEHLGLYVSPDIDTLVYTLAGVNNPQTGWGRADETWSFMSGLAEIGAPNWFQLGDKDLALNVYRTSELRSGKTLSEVMCAIAHQFDLKCQIAPMSDDPVRTMIDTDSGPLEFQDYFVREKCRPVVRQIRYQGIERAKPSPDFQALLGGTEVMAFVICPSNPYLSIDPIITIPGVHQGMADSPAPVVAVSPVVAGQSLKGPTSKMMDELNTPCTAVEVARRYQDLIDGIVIDNQDMGLKVDIEETGVQVVTADIIMNSAQDKIDLAQTVLLFAQRLATEKRS